MRDDGTEPRPGIYRKFTVMRTDGSSEPGGKHESCHYFVLDWIHDKYAVPAALAYAAACEAEYPELASDLRFQAHNTPYPKRLLAPGAERNATLLTVAIEQDRRDVIEACAKAISDLPVVGIATVSYLSALTAALRAVCALGQPNKEAKRA